MCECKCENNEELIVKLQEQIEQLANRVDDLISEFDYWNQNNGFGDSGWD